ncbi:mandelate racemase/muconate lactonizing enzyme family protein [Roseovarius phycicola]|uniref:Mandelate racemase/muconate lactonizing enzyme family protein n=1 Tax=Roseovarius phycicola TaxID=3080976 RepID=A0ABZ2HKP1_9RHOB
MRIINIETIPFEPCFTGGGYAMSFVIQNTLYDQLVRITLEDGSQGVGENVRWPAVPMEEAEAAEAEMIEALKGRPLADLAGLIQTWCAQGRPWRGLCFALDTAYHHLISQKLGVPLVSLLGGPTEGDAQTYLSLSSEAPDDMAEVVRSKGAAFAVIQAKLGIGEVSDDIDRVRAVLNVMTPDQLLLADFNGALSVEQALTHLGELDDPRLIWEEPCNTYDENLELARKLAAPLMFDQSMIDLETYVRAVEDRAAHSVVIKPALLGSLSASRTARDMCATASIKMRIDGPWCGQIGAWAALSVAAGSQPGRVLASIDLTEPIETPSDLIVRNWPNRIAPSLTANLVGIFDDYLLQCQ